MPDSISMLTDRSENRCSSTLLLRCTSQSFIANTSELIERHLIMNPSRGLTPIRRKVVLRDGRRPPELGRPTEGWPPPDKRPHLSPRRLGPRWPRRIGLAGSCLNPTP